MSWFKRHRDLVTPPAETPRPWGDATADIVLRVACGERVRAVVVVWPQGHVARARFHDLGPRGLRLALDDPADAVACPQLAAANVSFQVDGRARVFLAPVLGVDVENPHTVIRVLPPASIAGAEARLSFRVPAPPDGSLAVEVHAPDGDAFPARAVNLSVSGILVELPAAVALPAIGEHLGLRLEHGGQSVRLSAVVRRTEGHRVGLFFAEIFDRAESADAQVLRQIVGRCTALWTGPS